MRTHNSVYLDMVSGLRLLFCRLRSGINYVASIASPSPPLYRLSLHLLPTCPRLFFTSPTFQRYKAKPKELQEFRFLHTTPTFME